MVCPYQYRKSTHVQKAQVPSRCIRVTIMNHTMPLKAEQTVSIDTIMEMTRVMDEASSSGEWDVVTDLEKKRQPLIRIFFGDLTKLVDGPETGDKMQQLIQTILTTDLQIMQRADQTRMDIGRDLQSISKGQRVAQAYIQNQA